MQSVSLSNLAPQLSRALETWSPRAPGADAIAVVTVPVPLVASEDVFAAGSSGQTFLWAPSGDTAFVAEGVVAEVTASGPDRFRCVRDQVQTLLAGVRSTNSELPSPRMFGGFSFQERQPRGVLWRGFESAHFVLPRICYSRDDERAWLSLSVRQDELKQASLLNRRVSETVAWFEGVLVKRPAPSLPPPASTRMQNLPDREGWDELVSAIKREIQLGSFQKIVAARRAVCRLEPAPRAEQVLRRLGVIAKDCTRFATRRGSKLFLGATPEWLLRKQGRHLQTEALAGSRSSREVDAEQHLLDSQKDLGEHRLVVDEILAALGPLTTGLVAPPQPGIRHLRDILHLYTPISATLRQDAHVLDLVERLHPTPAVGGTPHVEAHRWIAEHEPEERGWYASPVGWVDGHGDGQFVVALRSALLTGGTANIFAGAGIVAESNVELEFEETELKLAAMTHALGAG